MTLKIAKDLEFPADAVTQTFGILGRKRSGKSHTACVLVEEMLRATMQVVVIDCVGNWYGLRIGADGKTPGFDIPVIGGLRGDVPIEDGAGAMIADLVVDKRIPAVIDVSGFHKSKRKRFVADFAEQLFQRQKRELVPIHLVLEEAQLVAPQFKAKGEERMLGAITDIVRLGGNYGIGSTLISQRPQSISKEVLSQVECLIVLQMNAAQERKAIEYWIVEQGVDIKERVRELPALPQGTAFVWSPQWLQHFGKHRIRQKRTYNSTATPSLRSKPVDMRSLTAAELGEITGAMADVVERAKADDPRELRRRIAQLERDLAAAAASPQVREVQVPVFTIDELAETILTRCATVLRDMSDQLTTLLEDWADRSKNEAAQAVSRPVSRPRGVQEIKQGAAPAPATRARRTPSHPPAPADASLGAGQRKILTVLAQHLEGRSHNQVALATCYAAKGGGFQNYISSMRTAGLIEGDRSRLVIRPAGLGALGEWEPLPTGRDLVDHWKRQPCLGKAEGLVLDVLVDAYPQAVPKDQVASIAGYAANGGGFNNALSRLRTLGLISGRGELIACDELIG